MSKFNIIEYQALINFRVWFFVYFINMQKIDKN